MLRSLRIGHDLVNTEGRWHMSATGPTTKTGACLSEFPLPQHVGGWVDAFLTVRHVLAQEGVDHLLVTHGGQPRREIATMCSNVVRDLIGVAVSPHKFRHIVATAMFAQGNLDTGVGSCGDAASDGCLLTLCSIH